MKKRLIPNNRGVDLTDIGDLHYSIAADIEDSLLCSGAVPGKDYTVIDLFRLANPFVLSIFDDEENKNKIGYSVPSP